MELVSWVTDPQFALSSVIGAQIDACGHLLGTALQASASKGYISVTKLLLQEGANVNVHGGFCGNALQAAAYHGHGSVVEILLEAGADVHQRGHSKDAMHAAAKGGHHNILGLLHNRGFDFAIEGKMRFLRRKEQPV